MGDKLPSRAVKAVRWCKEPEKQAWMEAYAPEHTIAEISAGFAAEFGFPLSRPQVSLWLSDNSMQKRRPRHRNQRMQPIGAERIIKRGKKDEYVLVKVREFPDKPLSKDNWKMKHVLVWEQANGRELPDGYVVMFGDRDKRNFDPANLVAVPKKLCGMLNQHHGDWSSADELRLAVAQSRLDNEVITAKDRAGIVCQRCGKTFHPGRKYGNKMPRTCPECVKAGHKSAPSMGVIGVRKCDVCGDEYEYHKKNSRRCPRCVKARPKCRMEAQRRHYELTGER